MENLVTIPATAERLGISKSFCYRLARAGSIPSIRIGDRIMVKSTELEAQIEAGTAIFMPVVAPVTVVTGPEKPIELQRLESIFAPDAAPLIVEIPNEFARPSLQCPLKAGSGNTYCDQAECGWWIQLAACCSVAVIGRELCDAAREGK